MSKRSGSLEYVLENPPKRWIPRPIRDFCEFDQSLLLERLQIQAARCMDCGIPYCHALGCPVGNRIPEFNEMVYCGRWQQALELLQAANNFPEITGRICPAPCEAACTLSINESSLTIRHIELQIVEEGWKQGWINPEIPSYATGNKVAIVGSGPAGLAAAQQLVRRGHEVVVFEKADQIGGLLRYGIPDFKLEKWIIDRRLDQLQAEGVIFEVGVDAGIDISARYMKRTFDAIVITTGATVPRDLDLPGRNLDGIHFAMDYLTQQNRLVAGEKIPPEKRITAKDKHVVVIGGSDTGSDCVGTSHRQGAREVTQIELLPEPPKERAPTNPWPTWPNIIRTSNSDEAGCRRLWGILTKTFIGEEKQVKKLRCVKLKWLEPDRDGKRKFQEIPGSEFELKADLVLLATGFVHPEHGRLIQDFDIELDDSGNMVVDSEYMTSHPRVFAAGDCVLGASLVVKAITQGRQVAFNVHQYLDTI